MRTSDGGSTTNRKATQPQQEDELPRQQYVVHLDFAFNSLQLAGNNKICTCVYTMETHIQSVECACIESRSFRLRNSANFQQGHT